MNLVTRLKHTILFGAVSAALVLTAPLASAQEGDYSFKVHNKTDTLIKQILVSQDKKNWAKFDIGRGIPAKSTVTLVWGKHTNDQACKQWLKAIYSDGSETESAQFDFCEEDLEVEYED